jgi:hypothetical protein
LAGALDRHHRDLHAAAAAIAGDVDGTQTAPSATPEGPLPTAAEAHVPDRHAVRRARFDEALALHGRGWPVRRIARAVGVNRQTVQGWLRSGQLPAWRQRPRGSSVDRHAEHLGQRWNEGCHNAAQLWREIQEQGFRGRLRTVQRWATGRRGADPTPPGLGRTTRAWPTPSKQRAAWLVVADPEKMDAAEQRFVDALIARSPELGGLVGLARRFSTMVRRRRAELLDGWLAAAKGSVGSGQVRRWAHARPRRGPGSAGAAVEYGAGGGPDQPFEDDQADHVRPRRLRAAAPPRPPSGLKDITAAPYLPPKTRKDPEIAPPRARHPGLGDRSLGLDSEPPGRALGPRMRLRGRSQP